MSEHEQTTEITAVVRLSNMLRNMVDLIGRFGSWFILPLVFITFYDVVLRKLTWLNIWIIDNLGRVWIFESTLLQELEWHMHTVLFALVLGFGYIRNTHVRVDLVRETLSFRKKAWLELIGCTFFMIPYTLIVTWFAIEYATDSFALSEISASQVGLSHRWIIKTVLVFGLIMAFCAGFSVWLQVAAVLFGPQDLRFPLMTLEWPENEGDTFEGKKRLVLDADGNVLVSPTDGDEELRAATGGPLGTKPG
ncbi:MAG: TRAP-type mannitol/chloroaromatic compound transport system permease small subunit [Gammaproteobacteria bacterium]|jgi:TRAP-type mannitol/chloroaromatic compound transport system permease small subunit